MGSFLRDRHSSRSVVFPSRISLAMRFWVGERAYLSQRTSNCRFVRSIISPEIRAPEKNQGYYYQTSRPLLAAPSVAIFIEASVSPPATITGISVSSRKSLFFRGNSSSTRSRIRKTELRRLEFELEMAIPMPERAPALDPVCRKGPYPELRITQSCQAISSAGATAGRATPGPQHR